MCLEDKARIKELEDVINLMLETIVPYREDGSCTIPEDTINEVNRVLPFTGSDKMLP
jgi:hypothetical protein